MRKVIGIGETMLDIIFKNNKPKYMLVDLDVSPMIDMTDDEKIDVVAARILKKYKPAFMELAK